VARRLLGHYQAALGDAEEALELTTNTHPVDNTLLTARAMAMTAKGLSLHLIGQSHEAIDCLQVSLNIYQSLDDIRNAAAIMSEIAMVWTPMGQHAQALPLYERALEVWRRFANLTEQAVVLNNLGVLHHMQGEYTQALTLLEEAHECALQSGYTRFVCFTLASIGDLFFDLELWRSAQKIYQQAFVIAEQIHERFLILYIELMMARLASATAEWRKAFGHLNTAGQLALDNRSNYEWAIYQLTMARYFLAQEKYAEAVTPLLDAQQRFAEGNQPVEEASTHFLLTVAYEATRCWTDLATHLQKGLSLAFGLESRHPVVAGVRSLKGLLQSGLQNGSLDRSLVNQVKQLLADITTFEQKIPF
jgi:tetratricopeptide (TPR) repeat protein